MGKHRRIEANGRSVSDQYIKLPYGTAQSLAWRSLSGSAVKVLIELYTRFNGRNNGQLTLSYADAEKTLGLGCATIARAFGELQAKGFIRLIKRGHWYGRKATEWAITNQSLQGNLPTHDWKHWRPENHPKTKIASDKEQVAG